MSTKNNKRAVETILVASGNAVLINDVANSATLPNGNPAVGLDPLMNSDGTVNLASGQLGIFDVSGFGTNPINCAIQVNDTIAKSPEIAIYQGTSTSQSPGQGNYPLTNNRPYEASAPILGRNQIVYTGKVCAQPRHSTWTISSINTPLDLTEYMVKIAFRGYRQDEQNSMHGTSSISPNYVTPDYTTLGTAQPTNDLIQNIVHGINKSSRAFNVSRPTFGARQPLVAFAVATSGSTGTLVSSLTSGTVLAVDTFGGTTKSLTLTAAMAASLQLALSSTNRILQVDTTAAGAGTSGVATKFAVMALDEEIAYADKVPQVKIRLEVGLPLGFDTSAVATQQVTAYEGDGQYRQWKLYYDKTAGQRKYTQYSELYPVIEYPSDLDPTKVYAAYEITHFRYDAIGQSHVSESPYKTIVLIPCCDTTTIASFERILNPWLTSTSALNVAGPTHRYAATLTGTSGTATVTVNGVAFTATFATSLTVTATNFVTANKQKLQSMGISTTSSGAVITFRPHNGVGTVTVANATGDLAGTVATTVNAPLNIPTGYSC